ncbi:MAG: polyphenol oxidase family protein [Gemmatimonadetes bacterium]|nr:polyphenol oxidase family protein [Gemmatimonadota bacterium]
MIEALDEVAGPFDVPSLVVPGWDSHGVVAGITTRGEATKPFDLGLGGLQPVGPTLERYQRLLEATGCSGLVVGRQVHGTVVEWHQAAAGLRIVPAIDGHAAATSGLLLGVSSADCVPVYLFDPVRRAVALLHAGWRGTAAGILSAGLDLLRSRGSRPADLLLHCGVGICGACYQVGAEVVAACGQPVTGAGPLFVDLRQVLADQATRAGVRTVTVSSHCSAHMRERFMSHRGSGGTDGRMLAFLGLAA